MDKSAKIVLGTIWGDEGKGKMVNSLSNSSPNPIVIRFSGGQQAGHCVIENNIKHVFSSYGAGTLHGIETYLTEDCTFYLPSILIENKVLKEKNVYVPKLKIHPLAKITTPYDVAYNRLMSGKGSTCGLGVGATMKRHLETPYKLHAIDLKYPSILNAKMEEIRKYYEEKIIAETNYFIRDFVELYQDELTVFFCVLSDVLSLVDIIPYSYLERFSTLIFEGSQGILLDMHFGIFPNVTFANTHSINAIKICKELGIENIETFYISRCYLTRHGRGWMGNEILESELKNNDEEINVYNKYQGEFRVGTFDYDLLNYAIEVDRIFNLDSKMTLVINCLDQLDDFTLDESKLKFQFNNILLGDSPNTFLNLYEKAI